MKVLIVADTYVPSRISGAIQLRDLAEEMAAEEHDVTVLVPGGDVRSRIAIEYAEGVRVVRVPALQTKDVSLARRALAEAYLPFAMLRGFRLAGLRAERWDGVVWYSPTIFLGLVAKRVKHWNQCKGYLIVRDLFPDWAVDAGMMHRGMAAYRFFKAVERFQYRVADVIGVQTPANIALVASDAPDGAAVEVLHNWLSEAPMVMPADSKFDFGGLAGRIIFVYAGNMGVAQDMGAFLQLAARLLSRRDIGFLFVGRGSEVPRLRGIAAAQALTNVRFMPEIDPALIPALLRQCDVGVVALDPRHTTHNIPGKFVTYVRNGLPVLARVNNGNDLVAVVNGSHTGYAVEGSSLDELQHAAESLADDRVGRALMGNAGRSLADRLFTPSAAAQQVIRGLRNA